MTIDKSAVAEKLQELYEDKSDNQYEEFFDWAAKSQRYRWETTFERIQKSLSDGSMADAKVIAEKMAEIGAGEAKKGVRGHKAHVAWFFRLDSVGRVARGDDAAELLEHDSDGTGSDEEPGWGDPVDDEYVTHKFQLRQYETINITLPADVTRKEAEKLGDFVKLLSFEPAEY